MHVDTQLFVCQVYHITLYRLKFWSIFVVGVGQYLLSLRPWKSPKWHMKSIEGRLFDTVGPPLTAQDSLTQFVVLSHTCLMLSDILPACQRILGVHINYIQLSLCSGCIQFWWLHAWDEDVHEKLANRHMCPKIDLLNSGYPVIDHTWSLDDMD